MLSLSSLQWKPSSVPTISSEWWIDILYVKLNQTPLNFMLPRTDFRPISQERDNGSTWQKDDSAGKDHSATSSKRSHDSSKTVSSSVSMVVRLSRSDSFLGLGGLITIIDTLMIVVIKIIIRDRPDIMGRLGLSQLDVTPPGTIRVSGHARLCRDIPAPSLDVVLTWRTSEVSTCLVQGDGIPALSTVKSERTRPATLGRSSSKSGHSADLTDLRVSTCLVQG